MVAILEKAQLLDRLDEVREWFNGYLFGETLIYNPWSIANFTKRDGLTEPYWINTSDNQLIKNLLKESPIEFKENFETLIMGGTVEKSIDDHMVFSYLSSNLSSVWSLLLMSGYLKQTSSTLTYRGTLCRLAIPNREVKDLFRRIIEDWLSDGYGLDWYGEFIKSLVTGRIDDFKKRLENVMLQIVSYHDLGKEPEAFYHGLMLGFTVSLYQQYDIKSNRESGLGRFDIMLIPKDKTKLGIVLELKVKEKKETLAAAAKRALLQIEKNNYAAEFDQRGISKVLKIGIGFEKKAFDLCYTLYPVSSQ